MSRLDELIAELCPNGVEYRPLWSVTIWDKRFNSVERKKQPQVYDYPYLLAKDLFDLEVEDGDVFLLSTGERTGWTTEELAGDNLREGEVVTIPWGKSRAVTDCIKYYKGKFVTADNRIMTSNDTASLLNKYLYYWIMTQGDTIDSFYRGSGIKHPDMAKVLDMKIPVPPLPVQEEIVQILDSFTQHITELQTQLTKEHQARKKQYEYYSQNLLEMVTGHEHKLGDIATLKTGKKPETIFEHETQYQYINAGTTISGYVDNFNCDGDTVTTPSRGQGGIGFVDFQNRKFWLGPLCYRIRSKDTSVALNRFLYFYLKSFPDKILQYKKEGGTPSVNASDLANIVIEIPSIELQKRIVSILDRFDFLCNGISTALPAEIEARQKQYEYYRDKLLTFKELGA